MTWRELFRRVWLVLRLRFKTFRVCLECGDLLDEWHPQPGYTQYFCPACKEWEELEREKTQRGFLAGLPSGPTIGELQAAMQNAYIPGYGVNESALQNQLRLTVDSKCPNCGAKASASWAFHDTHYCIGLGGCGSIFQNAIGSAIDAAGGFGIFS